MKAARIIKPVEQNTLVWLEFLQSLPLCLCLIAVSQNLAGFARLILRWIGTFMIHTSICAQDPF